MHRVLLVAIEVDDDGFDLEEPVVSGDAKLEDDLIALTNGGVGLHVNACYRQVDEQRCVLLVADGKRASTDEGDSEGTVCLGGLRFQ